MSSATRNNLKGWRLLGTPFTFALLLLFAPLLLMLTLSLWTQDYLTLDRTLTLNNYVEAWTHPVYQMLFKRSLYISISVTFLTILIAFPVAYYISFYGGPKKNTLDLSRHYTFLDKLFA